MRVTILLPFSGHQPVGGFKVAYEYANGLARRDHEVTVLHAPHRDMGMSLPARARAAGVFVSRAVGFRGGYRPNAWFRLDPAVRMKWVPSLAPGWAPPSDVAIATAWMTAEWLAGYPPSKGRKHYLIQHQESTFAGADPERVMATWRLPLKKIVIARWLEEIAHGMGEDATYIPNGLDFEMFGLDRPTEDRDPRRLIMLFHHHDWKGSRDGLAAMEAARRKVPGLGATLFGIPPPAPEIPDWVQYVRKPPQKELRRLYNEAAVFVGPSWSEGWPLPPAEAAQCGAALCLTDIGGHREYAVPEETALLSPAKDPEALSRNILRLVMDSSLRTRVAKAGYEYIQRFTWDRAVTAMENCLKA